MIFDAKPFDSKNTSASSSAPAPSSAAPEPTPRRRWLRILGWIAGSLLVLLILLLGAAAWYTTTPSFDRRARAEVVKVLEDSTGGRVEIAGLKFNLWHLAIEVDGLVIHGTEAPGQMPYLSANKILLHVRFNTFVSHTVGKGAQSHIGVDYLGIDQPHFHLIVYPDGRTNQPVPKKPSTSTEPVQDTLLDLQARLVQLNNGLAVIDDKAIPFSAAARDMHVGVQYVPARDRYAASVDLADLVTQFHNEPDVHSQLHLTAQLGRNMFAVDSLHYTTGANTHIDADAHVTNFNHPHWKADVSGAVDLKQLGYLAGVPGFSSGILTLDLHGHNCVITPQQAQQNPPPFWHWPFKGPGTPPQQALPPDPLCKAGYLMAGSIKAIGVNYRIPQVRVRDTNVNSQLRVTPTQLVFTALTGTLPGGGKVAGEMEIDNWLGEVPPNAPASSPTTVAAAKVANKAAVGVNAKPPIKSVTLTPVNHAHAYLMVNVENISLRTIMAFTAPEHYGDLGIDTGINGPVRVEWGGPVTDISNSVQVDADLRFRPTGYGRRDYPVSIPLTGIVQGHYDGSDETVSIKALNVQTPGSSLTVSGILGVNEGDPLTNLQVNLVSQDLSEFDPTLRAIGFAAGGKAGLAAVPVALHGTLNFHGSARGPARDLAVKGNLAADNLNVQLGSKLNIHIDSVVANAAFSPSTGVAIASSTIKRNTAVLNFIGTARPHRIVSRYGAVSYEWDKDVAVDGTLKLANAQVSDLLDIVGQEQNIPVTGTIDIDAKLDGTLADPGGSGNITLTNGIAYGERYQTAAVDFTMSGQQIDATKILLAAHGMSVTGTAAYNLASKHIRAQLAGNNLVLSKFDVVQRASENIDGTLSFNASMNGTVTDPDLHANLRLAGLTVAGKNLGNVTASANSVGSTLNYQLNAAAFGAQLAASGTTSLLGDYRTRLTASLANVNVANFLDAFSPGNTVKATSQIAATLTLTGPAKDPMKMAGTIDFTQFNLSVQGVTLKTAHPLTASLRNGIVTLAPCEILGPDSNLTIAGSAQVFGGNNPDGGAIHVTANGGVNMSLVQSFDPNLITSGKITLQIAADGRLKKPEMTGRIFFKNVNVAMDGIPNGISQMNGTMIFNEDRLDVEHLTAMTGGGKITLGGSILYQQGIYADLTASADTVRIRYAGLSATANAKLRLQGGPKSLYLSGNVLVTRFEVGKDVDFAMFAGAGGVSLPPDPTSPLNRLRLNVHIQSSPQMDFQNSYAKLAGSVDLTLQGTAAVPSVLGRITITEGSATFAGTKYELERGNIYFTNPVRIDPVIDLDVSTRVENYDITISVHGTMTNLVPTYRSSPPLTEPDIFNLLALGRTQEESQLYSEQEQQAGENPTTSALLGGALNATVSSRVSKLFGAGSVKIDPAFVGTLGNSAARITVEEPLSKQLTLTFATNVNETAEQLIQLQYQLTDNTAIVITRDENDVFSIVYKIRKRYH